MNRISIKIGGESGQGVNSVGALLSFGIKRLGFCVFGYREYPSLIKGGFSTYQVDFNNSEILSAQSLCDIAVGLSRKGVRQLIYALKPGGLLVHWHKNFNFTPEESEYISKQNIEVVFIDAKAVIDGLDGKKIMLNTFFVGFLWKLLGFDKDFIKQTFEAKFKKKDNEELLSKNISILEQGYDYHFEGRYQARHLEPNEQFKNSILISGNECIGLGAISAGVKAMYAYPMTPATSILGFLAKHDQENGMLVKQVADEITAAQMALGSSLMGTRAFTATSGGGFDLMTETISLAGMIEVPLVVVIAQRPGPATGVPTWTSTADLNIALYGGHGEFTRLVVSVYDAKTSYSLIQEAFNYAELYQIPVILLTDKQVAQCLFTIDTVGEEKKIKRGLVPKENLDKLLPSDRYKYTPNGISDRWLPGQSASVYKCNSDEHLPDGTLTEDPVMIKKMIEKRRIKQNTLHADLPEPTLFGEENGDMLLVSWGSPITAIKDFMNSYQMVEDLKDKKISLLAYEYLWPLKTEKFMSIKDNFGKVGVVENNASFQFATLIKQETGYSFEHKFHRYDGRPFFIDNILEIVTSLVKTNE